jgi:hypothetical protein
MAVQFHKALSNVFLTKQFAALVLAVSTNAVNTILGLPPSIPTCHQARRYCDHDDRSHCRSCRRSYTCRLVLSSTTTPERALVSLHYLGNWDGTATTVPAFN